MKTAKAPVLKKYSSPYQLEAVRNRFAVVVHAYCVKHKLTRKELADRWKVNETHLSSVLLEHKPITITLLLAAVEHAHINANYLLSGLGEPTENVTNLSHNQIGKPA